MEKQELLYEGKAKKIYSTNDNDKIVIYYKDDASAFKGIKRAQIEKKGEINNKITEILFKKIEEVGVPTHFIERLNDREQLCYKVNVLPIEIISRNIIAGSLAKRLNIEEGTIPNNTIYEINYKNKRTADQLINNHHAVALGICSYEELSLIEKYTEMINKCLVEVFNSININLVDLKLEFGKKDDGTIILADEISPDTCRLWDKETNDKMDMDRFRKDLGNVTEAYEVILERLNKNEK